MEPPITAWLREAYEFSDTSRAQMARTRTTTKRTLTSGKTTHTASRDIDEYIAGFPNDVQKILKKIRMTIRKAAPEADETISYRMPTFRLNGNLVHFAAFRNHIGFYPAPKAIEKFKRELSAYEGGQGSVRFLLEKPIPYDLIARIVKFRVKKNLQRAKGKGKA